MQAVSISMSAKSQRLILVLALGAVAIMLVHLGTLVAHYGFDRDHLFGLRAMFDVDEEENVPAVFSAGLLVIAGVLLFMISRRVKPGAIPRAALWAGLSVVFFYLAADESFEVHERIGLIVAEMLGGGKFTYYAWLVPYGIAGIIFVILYWPFYRQLDPETRRRFLTAAALYVGGAFGTEIIAGVYVHFFNTEQTLGYDLLSALEEALEMAGMIWFIRALVIYLEKNSAPVPKHRGAASQTDSPASTSA